jgi:hypothetical protein
MIPFSAALCILSPIAGCSYRFTNVDAVLPGGMRTIAIESVYDTSGEILPHGLLWREVQLAIARNSRFRVTNRSQADMLLRLHINSGVIAPSGSPEVVRKNRKDPKPYEFKEPPRPSDFDSLFLPSQFLKNETLAISVVTELWSARDKKIIFSSTYTESQEYNAIFPDINSPMDLQFIRAEEQSQNVFVQLSSKIASRFIRDLLGARLTS